jgi:hypothetical protein
MANVTIAIDQSVLRRARAKAAEDGTSVNALVTAFLARYAGADPTAAALTDFLEIAGAADAGSGPAGRRWSREDLYDRPRLR